MANMGYTTKRVDCHSVQVNILLFFQLNWLSSDLVVL